MDIRLRAQRAQFIRTALIVDLGEKVGFVHQHHRLRAAAADQGKVALHPPWVVVGSGIRHHRHHVHVRADHLFLHALAWHFAGEAGLPG
jgi:hypothetical protein